MSVFCHFIFISSDSANFSNTSIKIKAQTSNSKYKFNLSASNYKLKLSTSFTKYIDR